MSTHVQEPALRCPVSKAKVVVKLQSEVVIHNAILKVDPPTAWVRVPRGMSGDMTPS